MDLHGFSFTFFLVLLQGLINPFFFRIVEIVCLQLIMHIMRKHQEILVDIENSLVEVNEALNQAQKSLEHKKNGIDKSEEAL